MSIDVSLTENGARLFTKAARMARNITLIAEVSTNHGGNIRIAHDFIDAFASAGADIIKFQATRIRHLRLDDPQYSWFAQCELGWDRFAELKFHCEERNVHFLLTAFHPAEVTYIQELGCKAIKVGSGEAHQKALAIEITGRPFQKIFVSTGVRPPHALYRNAIKFGCVSRYPCSVAAAGIVGLDPSLSGWSDHCIGLDGCRRAIECGTTYIEKHVQLKHQARDPQPFEATVEEFAELRQWADQDPDRFLGRWGRP